MSRPQNNFWTITPPLRKPYFFLYSMSTYLNPNSAQFQLNFDSTSFQPQPQINLNSNSTLTSTQYGCDIKATQSCHHSQQQKQLKMHAKSEICSSGSAHMKYHLQQCMKDANCDTCKHLPLSLCVETLSITTIQSNYC